MADKIRLVLISFIFLLISSHQWAQAADNLPRICLILDKGGRDDKSFNQMAYEGFLRAQKDFSLSQNSKYVTVREDAQSEQFIKSFSDGSCALVLAVGFNNVAVVEQLAPRYPKQLYAAFDGFAKGNNIKSVVFAENEGGFLMGAIAALKSSTGKIGFIGGMEIPLIKRFEVAYAAGAAYINPRIKETKLFVGVTSTAWNNPSKAKELALSMYSQDVDIIFVAAGASSQGVFDAAEELNKGSSTKHYVIGVDSNQNYLAPGMVLTSMEKRMDLEVYDAIKEVVRHQFKTGIRHANLANGGVGWSYDQYNKSLLSAADVEKINQVKQSIIRSKVHVPDFYKSNTK
jgi:basic membrane protein A